jgi:hypothetical protein
VLRQKVSGQEASSSSASPYLKLLLKPNEGILEKQMEDLINARELHSLQKERMPDDDSDGKAVFAPKSEKSANKKSK